MAEQAPMHAVRRDRTESLERLYDSLEDFVSDSGGTTPIRKVLIANNGISAVKCIRSIRRWAYVTFGHERVVEFVAMATPEDLRANAEYIRMADKVADVPGGSNANNYANVNLIVQLALRYQVDAVWAGWGHASENPALPNTLAEHNVVFIGPPGPPMHALGDKIGSTIIAQSANVPTIAWNGDGIKVDYKSTMSVPPEVYEQANVRTYQACLEAVEKIGLPVMIKASEGGGGKGIRMVSDLKQVPSAFRQVQGEIPGSPIFVMKLAPSSRHLEVQLLCDTYGNAIALSGRDCSVQRRHQKIIEEGPPLAAPPAVWEEMCKAAVRLAKEVGYVNAGTVEYLYANNEFFFLELNPRLQVEHPVTEMITGVNLPAAQLQVAMGVPLHRIADVRRLYGLALEGKDEIDFDNMKQQPPDGHVIACRITAENPFEGFQPTSGRVQELNFRSSRDVWGYFSVDSSGRVHEFADSQIGHIFARGSTREHARRNMVMALNDLSIRGDIRTTIEYLRDMLECSDFKANRIDTSWLDARIKSNVKVVSIDPLTAVLVGAACRAHMHAEAQEKEYLSMLERGQLPPAALLSQVNSETLILDAVKYLVSCARSGPSTFNVACNGSSVEVEVRSLADGGFLVSAGGKSHVAYVKDEVSAQRFSIDQQTILFSEEYDPTQLRAQMGGKLLHYLVENGAKVAKGEAFAEVEVMKMNMPLLAQEAGVVHLKKPVGSVMEPGDVICTMVLDDPSKVKHAVAFEGRFPELGELRPVALDSMPHQTLTHAADVVEHVMEGFAVAPDRVHRALSDLMRTFNDPMIPVLQVKDAFSFVRNSVPMALADAISALIAKYTTALTSPRPADPAAATADPAAADAKLKLAREFCNEILHVITEASESKSSDGEPNVIAQTTTAISEAAERYRNGLLANAMAMVSALLGHYLKVEQRFAELELSDDAEKDDELQVLRREYADDLPMVYVLARSHNAVKFKNRTALELLELLERLVRAEEVTNHSSPSAPTATSPAKLHRMPSSKFNLVIRHQAVSTLREIAALTGSGTSVVALEARQLLIELQEPSYQQALADIEERLRLVVTKDTQAIHGLVHGTEAVLHKLLDVVDRSADGVLRGAALEVYVKRVYHAYEIENLAVKSLVGGSVDAAARDGLVAEFTFYSQPQEAVTMGMPSARSFDDLTALLSAGNNGEVGTLDGRQSTSSGGLDDERTLLDAYTNQALPPTTAKAGTVRSARAASSVAQRDATTGQFEDTVPALKRRKGLICFFSSMDALKRDFSRVLDAFGDANNDGSPVNVLHVMLANDGALEASPNAGKPPPSSSAEYMSLNEMVEDNVSNTLAAFMAYQQTALSKAGIRRVTFAISPAHDARTMVVVAGHGSGFFTFRHRSDYKEDRIVRHIETPLAFQLDLGRLANFNIALVPLGKSTGMAYNVHVYRATPKSNKPGSVRGQRHFVRALIRQTVRVREAKVSTFDAYPGPERVFVQALSALEAVQDNAGGPTSSHFVNNHIFLNMLGNAPVAPEFVEGVIRVLYKRYAKRLVHAHVTEVELKVNVVMSDSMDSENDVDGLAANGDDMPRVPVRIVASNPTGYSLRVDTYVEAEDPNNPGKSMYFSVSDSHDGGVGSALAAMGLAADDEDLGGAGVGLDSDDVAARDAALLGDLHGKPLDYPYPVISAFEERRMRAWSAGTCFVYDFPTLFRRALEIEWSKFGRDRPNCAMPSDGLLVRCSELVLDDELDAVKSVGFGLCTTRRAMGKNNIAMVAWRMRLVTPQYPKGREVVVIANDITSSAGSFGTREDELFNRASKLARSLGIPRVYIAANSGARIGMADEVKRAFKVKWVDPNDEARGYDYIYLDAETHAMLGPDGRRSVLTEPATLENGEKVFRITDVIGEGRDLGVENLRGSGTIAGETSRAYEETFTLTYVSGRTVGIGAYLVRLGQRTIQKGTNAPILLTGYQALNSLMGKEVYTSNLQLGGPKVMYNNGVSHQCVRNDLEGVGQILSWISYVPSSRGEALPKTALVAGDSTERDIAFVPKAGESFDPRWLLAGANTGPDGAWVSGFFDKGSFTEYLAGWARTVIIGRARLGMIPIGVITSETRSVEASSPADPAMPDSQERIWQQAGQVWFPDSAYKTSQAIRDFNTEGLPLMLMANWRGFSGGQRDMFDEVLKYGSFIVDALVGYKQPIFVYIPPYGELRGGAWVVVDPTINPEVMEMYAAPEARGNVLEPAGAVSIKFRRKDLIAAAHRLDDKLRTWSAQIKSIREGVTPESAAGRSVEEIKAQITEREALLLPVYHQVALHFGDLHDRPGRMMAKGVIRDVVPWPSARRYFIWRLRRRLEEIKVVRRLTSASATLGQDAAKKRLAGLLANASVPTEDDRQVHAWLDSTEGKAAVDASANLLRSEDIAETVMNLGEEDARAVLRGLMGLIGKLGTDGKTEERDKLVHTLRRGVFVLGTPRTNKPLE